MPALARLYGTLDVHLHHFRRYEKAELEQKLRAAGFALEDCRFLNRPGIVGWYLNGKILRRRVLPSGQLAAFRLLLPMLEREDDEPALHRHVAARDRARRAGGLGASAPTTVSTPSSWRAISRSLPRSASGVHQRGRVS